MDCLDRVTEGYHGELGTQLQEKTRNRIDWICQQVAGKNVLDIGCSQGICEILLARAGHHVTGIDIAGESISYAQKCLNQETEEVQKRVSLICADFLKQENLTGTYDTILMTEVLEHLEEPQKMVSKAMEYLCDEGKVIVTVPFGINDFPDHKHTFYVADIYEMLSQYAVIDKIKFMGAWIGFAGRKSKDAIPLESIDLDLLREEEQAFFALERPLQDQLNLLTEKYRKVEGNYQSMKETVQTRNEQLEQAKSKQQQLQDQVSAISEKYKKAEENYQSMKGIVQTRNEQLEQIKSSRQLLELSKKNELQVLAQAKDEAMQKAIEQVYRETATGVAQWKQMEEERFRMLEDSHREALNTSRAAYDALSEEHRKVRLELEDSRRTYSVLNCEHSSMHAALEDSRKAYDTLSEKHERTKACLEESRREYEELSCAHVQLNEVLEESRREYEELSCAHVQLNEVLEESRQEYEGLESEHKRVETELQQLRQMYQQLEKQQAELQTRMDENVQQNTNLAQTVQKQNAEIAQLKEQLLRNIEELEKEERLLLSVKQQLLQMNNQLQQAKQQNRIYEEKLDKVYGTWYGRFVLKCYKVLRKIKHMIVRK